jgi:hypothetical protein
MNTLSGLMDYMNGRLEEERKDNSPTITIEKDKLRDFVCEVAALLAVSKARSRKLDSNPLCRAS